MDKHIRTILVAMILLAPSLARAQEDLIPLTDFASWMTYKGFYEGGLYHLSNEPPIDHRRGGLRALARIVPRDTTGAIDTARGRIVLLSIGMSNATQEFSAFRALAMADSSRNPQLVIVDGAQGGQTAAIIAKDTAQFWRVVDERLRQAGVTRAQVQVAWIKEANARPTGAFPAHADTLTGQLTKIAQILRRRFPNIAAGYLSSRTYGGYATTTLNPEPYAYESGFAVRWLIENQIAGFDELEYEGDNPRAPWLAWGPYLWANGTTPRGDGLTWEREDFLDDGTHPSQSGRQKVARMLLAFFQTDAIARQWYQRRGAVSSAPPEELPTMLDLR